ncbi:CDP-glycerol glycerophosphotransferase family protein [Selenomonas sp. KH1T6]|uniref:CDP-glycerol glycerophosphotransferase family protein n=1 Tax=Selenomonas sp. KH1T6 TaxID=3158784 RepID=UPI001114BB52
MEKQFDFTIIMAVYNVEPFLREAVMSVISQDIGFVDNVQLILVDDGSNDGSGKICDNFAELSPENIMVIHQENAGVSAARNAGLPYIRGKYVNFLDADDKLSSNTLSKVREFFKKHGDKLDLVSIPMEFFDAKSGNHPLNRKFNKGTRVIDLTKEPDAVQLSLPSSFIKAEALAGIYFDTELAYAEDAKVTITILMQRCMLGVLSEPRYYYRRRSQGAVSAIQQSEANPQWYVPYMERFAKYLFEASRQYYGNVLPFVQHDIMYDLQWRMISREKMKKVLTEEEINQYCSLFYSLLEDIDDEVILAQKNIWQEQKTFLWRKKHGMNPELRLNPAGDDFDLYLSGEDPYFGISHCKTLYEFLNVDKEKNSLTLEGYTTLLGIPEDEEVKLYLRVNGQQDIPCESVEGRNISTEVMGEVILPAYTFHCTIENLSSYEKKGLDISLVTELRGVKFTRRYNLRVGDFFPLGRDFKSAYAERNGWFIRFGEEEHLILTKVEPEVINAREEILLKEMAKQGEIGKEAVRRRRMARLLKPFFKKEIWLVSDRINKADDNGEALFAYLQKHEEIDTYFVISKDSVDFDRLKEIGKTVDYLSEEHLILHLMADRIVSSSGDGYVMNPFGGHRKFYRDLISRKQQVFLQHGITKDDISAWINRYNKDFSMIVTAALPEHKSILEGAYFYDGKIVRLTGFPRHDRLNDNARKQVAIMPTWRNALLRTENYSTKCEDGLVTGYEESSYFKFYHGLLNDEKLLSKAHELGYEILFFPHPRMLPFIDELNLASQVKVGNFSMAYKDVFGESSLVVTDFSSVQFDFTYMRKPVVYAHFDKEEFFQGQVYDPGYFDYERDGFGEVEYDLEHTVDRIIEYMENGCQLKDKYRERIEKFFGFHDKNNCQRTFEAILSLGQPESFTSWQTADEVQTTDTSMVLLQAAAKSKDNEALRAMTALPDMTPPPRRDHLRYIFPAHLFKEGERVAIYAAGEVGTEFYRQAKKYGYVEPVMIVDRNAASMQATADLPVQPVKALLNEDEYDSVLIAIRFERIAIPVKEGLIAIGIPEEKIKWDGEVYFADDWGSKFWKRKTEDKAEA